MDNVKEIALLVGLLCDEANISAEEIPRITLVEAACRLIIARARKQAAQRTVVAEPPCPFGEDRHGN